MSYTIQGGSIQTAKVKLSTTSPTVIVDGGSSGAIVVAVYAAEIAGATPNLTLEVYNGSTSTYLRNAKAMSAKEENVRDTIITLKAGESLRATASAANQIDVIASYIPRDALSKGGSF